MKTYKYNPLEIQIIDNDHLITVDWIQNLFKGFKQQIGVIFEEDIKNPWIKKISPQINFSISKDNSSQSVTLNPLIKKSDKKTVFLEEKISQLDQDLCIIFSNKITTSPKIILGDRWENINQSQENVLCYVLKSEKNSSPTNQFFSFQQTEELQQFILTHMKNKTVEIPLNGLVLTGGKSKRMGKDKSQLDYHGIPQWQHCANLLKKYCGEIFISCREEQSQNYIHSDFHLIHDTYLEKGPMGGILSAMEKYPNTSWMVVACDLPYLDSQTLDNLIIKRNPFKIASAYKSSSDSLPEPLCAIYEPKAFMKMLQFLSVGVQCPRKVLIQSDSKLIDPINQQALDNINSSDEYNITLKQFQNISG